MKRHPSRWRTLPLAALDWIGAGVLLAILVCLAANVGARALGLPLVGANLAAGWLFVALAFSAVGPLLHKPTGRFGPVALVLAGFSAATLLAGLIAAAQRVGGIETVLAIPSAWRYGAAAALIALGLLAALIANGRGALPLAVGLALSLATLPASVPAALVVFAIAVATRTPIALALVAAASLTPHLADDAALAQTVVRGLSISVLLAVPLFVLAASLMVAGGIGAGIVAGARWLAGRRPTALGEANVLASTLFGGVSGSSIADAAMNARLLVPAMVEAGYEPRRAVALTAASAVLPNVLPPSIALLLAAAATDQSVGALWLAGVGAGAVLALALWLLVRLRPPDAANPGAPPAGRVVLVGLLPPVALAAAIVGGLRAGLVTPVEAGVLAVLVAGLYCLRRGGVRGVVDALAEAARQSGRIALLIGAAAPVSFVFATSGFDLATLMPTGDAFATALVALVICLLVGTVLDAGAAILLVLPILVPLVVAAGYDPVHITLVLTTALLVGGLTPPVGILVLVAQDVSGVTGAMSRVAPYVLVLTAGIVLLLVWPALTVGLTRL